MRTAFFAFIFGLSLQAFAMEAPTNQCYENSCSPEQARIWEKFERGGAFSSTAVGKVFSGSCYHKSFDYNGSTEHFGVVYPHTSERGIHFGGSFGFFYPQNPYADWTPENAENYMKPKRDEKSVLHLESNYAWVDFNPGEPPIWRYYVRMNGEKLVVMGFWGVSHTLFCELGDNAQSPR